MTPATEWNASAIACNPGAIAAGDRPRYHEIVVGIREAIRGRKEVLNGYEFRLDAEAVSPPAVAEWMAMERFVLPFPDTSTLGVRLGIGVGADGHRAAGCVICYLRGTESMTLRRPAPEAVQS